MTPGSNTLPDTDVAVLAHRLAVAQRAVRRAKAAARLKGVAPGDLARALKMLGADPDKLATQQQRMGSILVALKAATLVVEADLFSRTSDETAAQRAQRIWNDGYLAAVLGDGNSPGLHEGEDGRRWSEGWAAFHAALEDYEQREARRAAA